MIQANRLIRQAVSDDIDSIVRIDSSCHVQWTKEEFIHEMGVSFSHTLVAEINGNIVGFIVIWYIAPDVQIQNIAVLPKHRRMGLARELLRSALISVHQNGALKVLLEVREKNIEARAFYKTLGFREISVRKNYYPDDNALVMEAQYNEDQ